jgi:hypothetical protein
LREAGKSRRQNNEQSTRPLKTNKSHQNEKLLTKINIRIRGYDALRRIRGCASGADPRLRQNTLGGVNFNRLSWDFLNPDE